MRQADPAERSGISRECIARLKTGHPDPSFSTLVKPATVLKVKVGSLLEYARRRIMSEHEHYPTAFLPITQRILASFAKTLNEERARAVEEGLPGEIV